MVFSTIQIFASNRSSENIFDCIQRCICADGYDYIEENGECFREVRTFIFFSCKIC